MDDVMNIIQNNAPFGSSWKRQSFWSIVSSLARLITWETQSFEQFLFRIHTEKTSLQC